MYYDDELYHYGVKGMKWGVRRRPDKLHANKTDLKATRRVKNDYNKLSDREFRRKYKVGKGTYARRVAKSATGDPLADRKAKMSKKSYDRAVRRESNYLTSLNLSNKAQSNLSKQSKGKKFAKRMLLGVEGTGAYESAKSSGMSRKQAAALVGFGGARLANAYADRKYKKSGAGKSYRSNVARGYYS